MTKVRFLEDAEIRDGAGNVRESYKAGAVHDLRDDKAKRWTKRGKAELVTAPARPAPKPASAAPAPKPEEKAVAPKPEFGRAQQSFRDKGLKGD